MSGKSYSQAEKTALILLGLGEELAADILKRLAPAERQDVIKALQHLPKVSQVEIHEAMLEFQSVLQQQKQNKTLLDPKSYAEKVIPKAFGQDLGRKMLEFFQDHNYQMRCLQRFDPPALAMILKAERTQTIALVLAHAKAEQASAILMLLPESKRSEILLCISQLSPVDQEVLRTLDDELCQALEKQGHQLKFHRGGPAKAAAILNALGDQKDKSIEDLARSHPELAESIQFHLRTLEDLPLCDRKACQEIHKRVPRDILLLSLRGGSPQLITWILSGLSERSQETFQEDFETLGPRKREEVRQAQQAVLELIRDLEAKGLLYIPGKTQLRVV